jgi:putative spermidine/putrescine transport system ATP-binding protein
VTVSGNTLRIEALPEGVTLGTEVTLSVRPEDIFVVPGSQEGENSLQGRVTFVRDVGSIVEIYLDCQGIQIISQSTPKGRPAVKEGDTATAVLPSSACVVLKS